MALEPITSELRPLDDPFHLVDPAAPFQGDLDWLLKENGFSDAAPRPVPSPKLIFLRSACAIQGGYAFGVLAYLQRPDKEGVLRSSTATAIRARQNLTAGLRQAVVDSATALLQTLKESSSGGPLLTLHLSEAPQVGGGHTFIPIQKLRMRIQPEPPRLNSFARSRGIHGVVRVSVIVGPDGLPERADYLSGPPELAFPALAYAFQHAFVQSETVQTFRTELAVPFGAPSRSGMGLPGEGLVRTIPTPAESIATPNGVMPER